ncbi:MAG: hypothetical protein ABI569_13715 [Casimicrobiaceae bacterium]
MVNMTEAVGAYLEAVLKRAHAPRDAAVRIELSGSEALSPKIDHARPDDARLLHHGRTVLVLDARTSEYLDRSMLDVEETPDGPKLLVLQ